MKTIVQRGEGRSPPPLSTSLDGYFICWPLLNFLLYNNIQDPTREFLSIFLWVNKCGKGGLMRDLCMKSSFYRQHGRIDREHECINVTKKFTLGNKHYKQGEVGGGKTGLLTPSVHA